MDYLYICKKGTTMWNEMSNPAVLIGALRQPRAHPHAGHEARAAYAD